MSIQKTKDYDMFVLREDNRAAINVAHVKRLADSILARNLLHMRPIIVNKRMEVIDGQHRLLAAKQLNTEIYYKIEESLDVKDVITLNVAKAWGVIDYLNFYIKNGYGEYQKLQDFMSRYRLQLKIALAITLGNKDSSYTEFKEGKYVFSNDVMGGDFEICWRTIDYINKTNGARNSYYAYSSRFWKSLLKLVRSANFDEKRWFSNLPRFITRMCGKATGKDYEELFEQIHNWKSSLKISLSEEE